MSSSATERAAPAAPDPPAGYQAGISRGLTLLLAVACGATVANLYYAQPLLSDIARSFGISDGSAGLLVTVSQVGYALGLVFIVPLGDLVDRRRLVVRLLAVCAVALVGAAVAPGVAVLAIALALASVVSVVVQILIPFASTLAQPHERGQVVGTVMSGLLSGILLARTVSGIVAGIAGWRAPFVVAAVLMVILAVTLWRVLPRLEPPAAMPYGTLLRSIGRLVATEPALRRRMVYGACGYGSFSVVWTTLAFLLSSAPYNYGLITIGLFGLAGLVGALGASRVGGFADRGLGGRLTGLLLVGVLLSWAELAIAPHDVVLIIIGLVLIDFGVQGVNVCSQHVIYGLGAENASRVTTAFMTANFAGAAIGSAAGSAAWDAGGWRAVCAVGGAMAVIAMLTWLTEARVVLRGRAQVRA